MEIFEENKMEIRKIIACVMTTDGMALNVNRPSVTTSDRCLCIDLKYVGDPSLHAGGAVAPDKWLLAPDKRK